MLEAAYQRHVKKRINELLLGCLILKNDPEYLQGVPDLLILYRNRWAMLEVKTHQTARVQPNQRYYIEQLNSMSFADFIYPENEEEVLNALQQALQPRRSPRLPKP